MKKALKTGGIFLWALALLSACRETSRIDLNPGIKTTLVSESATPEALNVYHFLRDNYGRKILSGTMATRVWNAHEAEWIYNKTGKYPALYGFDLMDIADTSVYADLTPVADCWQKHSLVHLMWHWSVPDDPDDETLSFYVNQPNFQTSFNINRAVTPGTWEYSVVMADLDKAANVLLRLQERHIPVLWRPLHEAAGGWFWWGAHGAEPLKKLWILMFDHFKAKGIHNLIWIWTEQPGTRYWYPGDDYVDIIGCDIYERNNNTVLLNQFNELRRNHPGKIITLSECGKVPNLNYQWNTGLRWSFFMPWYDYDRTNDMTEPDFNLDAHQYANTEWWLKSFENPAVLDQSEMPDLR